MFAIATFESRNTRDNLILFMGEEAHFEGREHGMYPIDQGELISSLEHMFSNAEDYNFEGIKIGDSFFKRTSGN